MIFILCLLLSWFEVQIQHLPFLKTVCLKESFIIVTGSPAQAFQEYFPHIFTYSFIWLQIELPSLSRKSLMTPSHIQPPQSGSPKAESGLPGHRLTACHCGPNVILPSCCAFCFMTGACLITRSHSRNRHLPGNKKLLDATCLGHGHILLPSISHMCFCLYSFILRLKRGLSPILHKGSWWIKKLTEDQRMAKPCQNLIW